MKKIYLLGIVDKGHYKIGITRGSIDKRIKQLQTGNAETITLINVFESDYNNIIEKTLHRRYSHKKLSGEWFELDEDEVDNFMFECEKLHDNFKAMEDFRNPHFIKKYRL